MPAIITTASHSLASSRIKIGKRIEKFITYSALLSNTSTGKTPAMEIAETAAYNIEDYKNCDDKQSTICNGATVEATIQLLKDQGKYMNLIQNINYKKKLIKIFNRKSIVIL